MPSAVLMSDRSHVIAARLRPGHRMAHATSHRRVPGGKTLLQAARQARLLSVRIVTILSLGEILPIRKIIRAALERRRAGVDGVDGVDVVDVVDWVDVVDMGDAQGEGDQLTTDHHGPTRQTRGLGRFVFVGYSSLELFTAGLPFRAFVP